MKLFSVARLQVYLKNMQQLLINFVDRIIIVQLIESEIIRQITLIEYFKLNKIA